MTYALEVRNSRGVRMVTPDTVNLVILPDTGEVAARNDRAEYVLPFRPGSLPAIQVLPAMTAIRPLQGYVGYYPWANGRLLPPTRYNIWPSPGNSIPVRSLGLSSDVPASSQGWGLQFFDAAGNPIWDSGKGLANITQTKVAARDEVVTIPDGSFLYVSSAYEDYAEDIDGYAIWWLETTLRRIGATQNWTVELSILTPPPGNYVYPSTILTFFTFAA